MTTKPNIAEIVMRTDAEGRRCPCCATHADSDQPFDRDAAIAKIRSRGLDHAHARLEEAIGDLEP